MILLLYQLLNFVLLKLTINKLKAPKMTQILDSILVWSVMRVFLQMKMIYGHFLIIIPRGKTNSLNLQLRIIRIIHYKIWKVQIQYTD